MCPDMQLTGEEHVAFEIVLLESPCRMRFYRKVSFSDGKLKGKLSTNCVINIRHVNNEA